MRIYMYGTGRLGSVEANEVLLNIISEKETMKESLNEKDYGDYVVALHNHMREHMGLPNKIFSIVRYDDNTKAEFVFFDKEPDGKHYEVFVEETENGFAPYIEVEV